jgi:hypothetical protein
LQSGWDVGEDFGDGKLVGIGGNCERFGQNANGQDRLSFQQFIGLGYDEEIPDFTTIWHFKEGLVKLELVDTIFVAIVSQI